jgi:AcrR family transcriptional regulator
MRDGGPSAVTYSALTRESGVGRATIYRHWPSLDQLWPDLIRDVARAVMFEPSGDLRADLLGALGFLRGHVGAPEGLVELLAMFERSRRDEQARELLRLTEAQSPIRQVLDAAKTAGRLEADHDVDLAVALLTGPLLQRLLFGSAVDDAFLEAVVDNYLEGPAGPTGPGPAGRSSRT